MVLISAPRRRRGSSLVRVGPCGGLHNMLLLENHPFGQFGATGSGYEPAVMNSKRQRKGVAVSVCAVFAVLTFGCGDETQRDGSQSPASTTTLAHADGTSIDRSNLPSGAAPGDGSGQGKAPSGADSNSGGGTGNGPGEGNSVGR